MLWILYRYKYCGHCTAMNSCNKSLQCKTKQLAGVRPPSPLLRKYLTASKSQRTTKYPHPVTPRCWLTHCACSVLLWNRKMCSRGHLKCDGTRAETRFRLSEKRTSPFKSVGVSVQSTTNSRGLRISGRNAGYTMFRGSVKGTGYPLHSPVSLHFPSRASHFN